MNSNRFNLLSLLELVRKWRLPVLAVVVAAILISSIISLLIPNKFQSTAIFYTTNPRSADPEWIFQGDEKIEVNMSTSTRDIDRMITIGESRTLAESIIRRFDLFKDYGIDTTDRAMSLQYALEEFKSNYSIAHNSRDAVEVSFIHSDNQKAAAIANAIVEKIDEMAWQLTRENRRRVLALHETRFKTVARDFGALRDSLEQNRKKYNMFSQDRQSRELAGAVTQAETKLKLAQGMLEVYSKTLSDTDRKIIDLKAEINGQKAVLAGLLKANGGNAMNLEYLARSVDRVNELSVQHNNLVERYEEARLGYDDAQIGYNSRVSAVYVVQKAVPSMRKAKPIRWLIVASATLISLFASLVLISFYELYQTEKRKVMA